MHAYIHVFFKSRVLCRVLESFPACPSADRETAIAGLTHTQTYTHSHLRSHLQTISCLQFTYPARLCIVGESGASSAHAHAYRRFPALACHHFENNALKYFSFENT